MDRGCCGSPDATEMAWFPEGAVVTRKHGYAERLDVVRSAASDAGRDPQAVTPAGAAFVVTGFGRDEVDEALQSDAVKSRCPPCAC